MTVHSKEYRVPLQKLVDGLWVGEGGRLKKNRGEKEMFKIYYSPKGHPEKLNRKICKMI